LVVPLLNPYEVIDGKMARFSEPIFLDLNGLGIRDMAFDGNGWLIIGGSSSGNHDASFEFFHWAGPGHQPEKWTVKYVGNLHPEAIIIYPQFGLERVQILSDDGRRKVEGVEQKGLPDPSQRTFRSVWLVK